MIPCVTFHIGVYIYLLAAARGYKSQLKTIGFLGMQKKERKKSKCR